MNIHTAVIFLDQPSDDIFANLEKKKQVLRKIVQSPGVAATFVKLYANKCSVLLCQNCSVLQDIPNIASFHEFGFPLASISKAMNALEGWSLARLLQELSIGIIT